MNIPSSRAIRRIVACLYVVLSLAGVSFAQSFSFSLSNPSTTSVGIFDSNDKLIKTIWGAEPLPAGSYTVNWDGTDNVGNNVSAGSYTWKVAVNGDTYSNGVQIGNTGVPTTTAGHIPIFIESVATDSNGDVYTVNGYEEGHLELTKWSGSNGHMILSAGQPDSNQVMEGIAVEPDGSVAYSVGVTGAGDLPNLKSSLYKVDLQSISFASTGFGKKSLLINFTSTGGPVQLYNQNGSYPGGASDADKATMSIPVRSLALKGSTIYVPDSLGQRVLLLDKTSGSSTQTISNVPVACGIAVDSSNNIWVGSGHSSVRVYTSASGYSSYSTPITGLTEVRSLSISGSKLYVADFGNGQVKRYSISGTSASLDDTFGSLLQPGDRAADRLNEIRGVATDPSGNLFIADRPGDGARLQKLTTTNFPNMQQSWQQLGLEFTCSATFSVANPDLVFSSSRHAYSINRATGGWSYLGFAQTDTPNSYFGAITRGEGGPPRAIRFNGNDYFYLPTIHGGMAVYRVIPSTDPSTKGPTLKLVSCVSEGLPEPDGTAPHDGIGGYDATLWSWNNNDNEEISGSSSNISIYADPSTTWAWVDNAMCTDERGYLWLAVQARWFPPASSENSSLWVLPVDGINAQGNPKYNWGNSFRVFSEVDGRTALGLTGSEKVEWKLVSHTPDGMIYALGSTDKAGTPQDGDLHPGGNVLMGFQEQVPNTLESFSTPKWTVLLPAVSAGLAAIPGGAGGVLIGGDPVYGYIHHYNKDGLLVGVFGPGSALTGSFGQDNTADWPTGRLDSFQCLSVERASDGLLDVFAQDNVNTRIIWYRVDDRFVSYASTGSVTVGSGNSGTHYALSVNGGLGEGSYISGTSVTIRADAPPPGKVFIGWTTSGGASVQSASSAVTTVTVPSSTASVTANYGWAPGSDQIKFYPTAGAEGNIDNSVFEGANDMNGPWTTFYDIPVNVSSPSGWNTISVNTGGFRYLRWRKSTLYTQGSFAELEFWRNGSKLTGTQFGTAAVGSNYTYDKLFDGNTSSTFIWDNAPYPGAYAGIDTGSSGSQQVATPSFSPVAGTYTSAQSVTISSTTSGASIRYTTDGSTPTSSSGTVYSGAVAINSTSTLKAIAYKSGMTDSAVASGAYTINLSQVAAPSFSPSAGTYTTAQSVTITSSTSGATIRYTTDGSTPTSSSGTVYSGAVTISSTGTLKAIAYKSGMLDSSVTSGDYTINTGGTDLIRFYPRQYHSDRMVGGVFEGTNGDPVTGTYTTIYTITSSPPTAWTEVPVDLGSYRYLRYRAAGTNSFCNVAEIEFYRNGTKLSGTGYGTSGSYSGTSADAYTAALDGNTGTFFDCSTATGAYVGIDTSSGGGTVAMPTFNPVGGTYSSTQNVTITSSTSGATIRYTTDGSTPSSSSGSIYSGPVAISSTGTLKAIAYKSGMADSGVTSATYTINLAQVAAPTFSPAAGTYTTGQTVTISSATSGATIRYTTDGTTPNQSNGIVGSTVVINANTTLKAIAYKTDMLDSSVTTGDYTISGGGVDKIRFYPRQYHGDRMVGGVFEGTNGDPNTGTYTTLYTIGSTPPDAWTEVTVSLGSYRYLRYRSPSNGFCNVAEVEFYRNGVKLIGSGFGTSGSYSGTSSDAYTAALDGNTGTFFDCSTASGAYVGIDTGASQPQVEMPAFSPGAGTYSSTQSVTISSSTNGASIRYTTDGSTPTSSSGTVYSGPVTVSSTSTLKAIAYKSGMTDSAVATAAYTINVAQVAAPSFSPAAGTYTTGQTVTISSATSGATIRYTTDGSTPTSTNGTVGNTVVINANTTLKAIATKSGMTDSSVTTGDYTISGGGVDKIRFYPRQYHGDRMVGGVFEGTNGDPVTGTYTTLYTISSAPSDAWTEVTVSLGSYRYLRYRGGTNSFGNVAEIEFYRNGVKLTGTGYGTSGTYSGGSADAYTAALDANTSTFFDSTTATGAYVGIDTGGVGTVATPTFSPGAGTYSSTQSVAINCATSGATIRYTTDGSTPTSSSGTVYSGAISVSSTSTLKAIAYKSGMNDSGVAVATFTINLAQVADPSFSPAAGTYSGAQTVTISSSTSGASIRYTTDGNTPTSSSGTVYSSPITISSTTTLRAIAYKSGMTDSNVTIGAYTITGVGDKVRFYPRLYHGSAMVGGVFEGTNGDPDTGSYTVLYTISSQPSDTQWTEVTVNLGTYRYLRYRSAATNSFGNVAEVEFYRGGTKLTGTGFGTAGTYSGTSSDAYTAALDGNTSSFFDCTTATGAYVGIDTAP